MSTPTTTTTIAPPTAPEAITGSASGITTWDATLTGTVDPDGAETVYHFEYGPTSAFGMTTPDVTVAAGTSTVSATAAISGLKSDVGYLFRLVATNALGTSIGVSETFTTDESSCVTQQQVVTSDSQTVQHEQSAVQQAETSMSATEASITQSGESNAVTVAEDQATVSEDQATVTSDQKTVQETTLTAPITGTVTVVNGSVGETVSASASSSGSGSSSSGSSSALGASTSSSSSSSGFITVTDLSSFEVVADYAEADATDIAVGEPVAITLPALPDVDVAGKVVSISPTATVSDDVVTYPVTIAVLSPPSSVKDGMTADVSIVVKSASDVLYLSSSAITTTGTVSTVTVLQDGKDVTKTVTIGIVGNSTTQIVSGLTEGETVVEPTVSVSSTSGTSAVVGGGAGAGGFFGGGGGGGGFRG